MRKLIGVLILLVLFMTATASAEIYKFSETGMFIELSAATYPVQITGETLDANEAELLQRGMSAEEVKARFESEGLLLLAYDDKNGRTIEVTAVRDASGQKILDIDEITPEERSTYRANHRNGSMTGSLGYSFESCEWKNFGGTQGRFLMLKYVRKINGETYYGLWRRTVKNGYTVTVDMQVRGRKVSSADITALNKIQDTIAFVAAEATEDQPVTLSFSVIPPEVTNSDTFIIKGTTQPGMTVVAAYASLKYNQSKVLTAMADGKGIFQFSVTLPREDLYNLLVSVTANAGQENEATVEQSFQTEYNAGLIPVTFTSAFPERFTGDSFKLTGTTDAGVTVQLSVNGASTGKKTGTAKTFSFTVDTSKEGIYTIMLTFSKKGYDTRIFNYTIERTMTQEEQRDALAKTAKRPEYANLKGNPDNYKDKVVHLGGYVVDVREGNGEYLMTFSMRKSGSSYKDLVMVSCPVAPDAEIDSQRELYGMADGLYKTQDENGKDITYPKVNFLFFK